ncbi:Uncharacterized protein HZ326_26131 [Fusarium oxysporum f. sp. albedinis]|nr:Uncharacterized protein HZ326_26131 [Fusarium oxysporum f. sp. albedinis]
MTLQLLLQVTMSQRKPRKFPGSRDLCELYLPRSPFNKDRTLKARDLVTGNTLHLEAIARTERVLKETSSTNQQGELEKMYQENLEALDLFWKS